VLDTRVGYANSVVESPNYTEVCTGNTDAAETVEVRYDNEKLNLEVLLQLFSLVIDPTSLNKQGHDEGTQYRTGVFWVEKDDEPVVAKWLDSVQREQSQPVVVENRPLQNFYEAEEYHQLYLDKNPSGYCHIGPAQFGNISQYITSLS
jgi:peptide methionine sulfoxide reductase msrA/msrB